MMIDLSGQQFGRYRLVSRLGFGGFASVYLGQHILLDSQQAAIKILHLTEVDSDTFRQEANTTATLAHPHIVRLLDFDIQQDIPYLILDYAPGGSLLKRHPKRTNLPIATIVQYVKDIATALQYAHDKNIIHRDMKPENILVGRHGELLLSDFGIAVLSKTGRTSLEQSDTIGGTAEYMAPEAFRGKTEKAAISTRWELWSTSGSVALLPLPRAFLFNSAFNTVTSRYLPCVRNFLRSLSGWNTSS